jgi:hypothetical protein
MRCFLIPQIYFQPDAGERELSLFHRLKLYADDESQSTTKPVVAEEVSLLDIPAYYNPAIFFDLFLHARYLKPHARYLKSEGRS